MIIIIRYYQSYSLYGRIFQGLFPDVSMNYDKLIYLITPFLDAIARVVSLYIDFFLTLSSHSPYSVASLFIVHL